MSDMAAELDETILRILASTEHGQWWLDQQAKRLDLERRLETMRKKGLSEPLIIRLWFNANLAALDLVEQLTPAQVKALNVAERQERAT